MKDTTFSIRISTEDLNTIKKNAEKAHMSQSDYVTACCLGKQVIVIEDMKEVAKQLRAIGNNLNQLTTLAHMGKVKIASLDKFTEQLAEISSRLRMIQEKGRWRK